MGVYVAFLRGINVSGQKKILMADLKAMMKGLDFDQVQTYLQSGNVIFESDCKDTVLLEKRIHRAIDETLGLDVKVLVRDGDTISRILRNTPFGLSNKEETKKLYYILFQDPPETAKCDEFIASRDFDEELHFSDLALYALYPDGYGRSKLNSNLLERKLGVWATARNYNTMKSLDQMLQQG